MHCWLGMMNLNNSSRTFLISKLVPCVVSPSAPKVLNLFDAFIAHVSEEKKWGPIRSTEFVTKHFGHLCDLLERHFSDWDVQGIPRPIAQTDQERVFVAWPHEQFRRFSGLEETIDRNFCEVFEFIQSLSGRPFLIICALWLKCMKFRTIYISDAKGDEGVDLLGLLDQGGLRALIAVVQAKTSNEAVTKGTVMAEYGKYKSLIHTEKYMEYRKALDIDGSIQGSTWTYVIMANQAFNGPARVAARQLGILLRSLHQISFDIAKEYTKSQIESEVNRIVNAEEGAPRVDLTTNFYNQLRI